MVEGVRSRTVFGISADRNALRAWSRCHPVFAHSSSRIFALADLFACLYRVAIVLVTDARSAIVRPICETPSDTSLVHLDTPLRGHSQLRQRRGLRGQFR